MKLYKDVRSILERFNGTLSISGTTLYKINLRGLETILQNASKHPKWGYCVQEGTAFKKVLSSVGYCV